MSFRIAFCLLFTLSSVVYGKDTRVAGGTIVKLNNFPYLASVKRISNNKHFCGAAIISARHIVTVAVCVDGYVIDTTDLEIRAGTTTVVGNDEYISGYFYQIEEIHLHPGYNASNENIVYENNIAVVKIQGSFELSPTLNIIGLPTLNIRIGQVGTLVGWGTHTYPNDSSPKVVRAAWMSNIDSNYCSQVHNLRLGLDIFCAFQRTGVGACIGDSGSPLVIDNELIGLVLVFEPCATGIPDIYTKVHSHLGFINSIINPHMNL